MSLSKQPQWMWALMVCILPLGVAGAWLLKQPTACKSDQELIESEDFFPEFAAYFPKDSYVLGARCDLRSDVEHKQALGFILLLAGEPVLWERKDGKLREGDFTTRVTHLPTFTHPHIVRVEKRDETITLHGTQLSGRGGYDYGDVQQTKTIVLTKQQADAFLKLYGDGLPGRVWRIFDYLVIDGTSIYLETYDSDGYRVLNETEGNYDRLDRLAIFLIEALGWDPHPPRT